MTRYSEYKTSNADGLYAHGVVESEGPAHTVAIPMLDGESTVEVRPLTQDEAREFRKLYGSSTPDVNSDDYKEKSAEDGA